MAKIARQLYYKKSGVSYPISLYDSTANVGANYLTLRVTSAQGDAMIAYAQIAAVGTPGNSSLRVRKSGSVYAVNSSAQDSTMITSGGGVVDNGSCFVPPSALTSGTYARTAEASWTASASWAAVNTMLCKFTVSYQSHISGVGVDHFRLRYGLTTACTNDGGVFSGTSRQTPELALGTYYFRVDAEDAVNTVMYSSAVYGGVANTYGTGNSTGFLQPFKVAYNGTYAVNNRVVITTSQSWTVPAGVNYIVVSAVAGGGGGSGGYAHEAYVDYAAGGGGSSGCTVERAPYAVTPGQSLSVVVGAGGAGGAGAHTSNPDRSQSQSGTNGGATSIAGLFSLAGGLGARYSHNYGHAVDWSIGAPSAGSGSIAGAAGVWSVNFISGPGGQGGVGIFGTYGKGGRGGSVWSPGDVPPENGQNGSNGIVIIEWYDSAYNQLAINSTSTTWDAGPGANSRFLALLAYTNQGYDTKYKGSNQFCADTCTCNCNYCTCNCNYCTCNCNYCTCNCNYNPCSCSSSP